MSQKYSVRLLSGTTEEWDNTTYIIPKDELVIERTADDDVLFKLGDGIHIFGDLPYINLGSGGGGSYTLPKAGTYTLGGIKIGEGFTTDALKYTSDTGTLSAQIESIQPKNNESKLITSGAVYTALGKKQDKLTVGDNITISDNGVISATGNQSYTLPVATSATLGGIKIGNGLSVDTDGKLDVVGNSGGGTVDIETETALEVVIDNEPEEDSENLITSGAVYNALTDKQDKLTVGDNITISDDGTISASSGVTDEEKQTWNSKQDALNITNASTGQYLKVSAVDSNGKPTTWTTDTPSGGATTIDGITGLADALDGIQTDLNNKVSAEANKGLSTNDFTNDLKNKLDSLSTYSLPVATANILGGIKIGDGLYLSGDNNDTLNVVGGGSEGSSDIETETATEIQFDNAPTNNSNNLLTSGKIYTALSGKQNQLTAGNNITINNGEISVSGLEAVAISGSYNDLFDKPTIPAASATTPKMNGDAAVGSETAFARGDHVHPTDTKFNDYRTAADQDLIDAGKQAKLTAGTNITINEDNVISASGSGGSETSVLSQTGDIIIRNSTGAVRLGIGTAGQVLTVVNGLPAWQTLETYGGDVEYLTAYTGGVH